LDTQKVVNRILDDVLGLGGRAVAFDAATPLMGAVPQLDSMTVATLLNTIEEQFGFTIEDDEIDGATFATVGSLVSFVEGKLR
jgi:acyl carrier protein